MRRHALLVLFLAVGSALSLGVSASASAVTDAQRAALGKASGSPATMQAAIATVL